MNSKKQEANEEILLTDEQLDFLKEMINIGAGNAASALSQLLNSKIDVHVPKIHLLKPENMKMIIRDPTLNVISVKISTVGDILGEILFILQEKDKASIVQLAEKAVFGKKKKGPVDISAIAEMGNIMAGVYLASIHDFTRLNIYHSTPEIISDMYQAIIDEIFTSMGSFGINFIVIENDFIINSNNTEYKLKAYWLLIPSLKSAKKLAESIMTAKDVMSIKR